jgi:hypothetical protein
MALLLSGTTNNLKPIIFIGFKLFLKPLKLMIYPVASSGIGLTMPAGRKQTVLSF